MAQLLIIENGSSRSLTLTPGNTIIGKSADNDVVLTVPGISRKHCQVAFDGANNPQVSDLGSRNGTYVSGTRIDSVVTLSELDVIQLGSVEIRYKGDASSPATPDVTQGNTTLQAPPPAAGAPPIAPAPSPAQAATPPPAPVVTPPTPKGDAMQKAVEEREVGATDGVSGEMRTAIHQDLLVNMDLKRLDLSKLSAVEIRTKAENTVRGIIDNRRQELPYDLATDVLIKEIVDEALALGPLEDLLADQDVTEIMVNNCDKIFVERKGKLTLSSKRFTDNRMVIEVIRRIIAPIGRRIDESNPMVDARLADGSRVNAIIPPLAISGPTITIRKFATDPFQISDLIKFGSMTANMAAFLQLAVKYRKNICISGGTGSGKTTLLNVISSFIPEGERIVTIEDAAELRLPQEHVVSLETKPANIEGTGAVPIRKLVINSLRMRPDRIVVGECRGGEALDMLQAMNTGHDGSLTTLHANTCRDAISRLETLVLMAGMDLPSKAIRDQISSAVDVIVQTARLADGSRRVTDISMVTGIEGDTITLQELFAYRQTGFDEEGKIIGHYEASGTIPRFMHELVERGVKVDLEIFRD